MTRGGFARLCVTGLAFIGALQAGRLDGRVKRLIAQSVAARQGFVGVLVVDENGHPLVAINPAKSFIPASNTKLFSTALALERLGPEKRFETRVERQGADLTLVGTGDANLSGRVLPYVYNAPMGPPLTVIDELAAQIAAAGIREVRNVIGDDTAFLYEPYASGWAVEDALNPDGAPVGALLVNDDTITVQVQPGAQDGAPAQIVFDPPLAPFQIENHVTTGPLDDVHTERVLGTGLWRVWGTILAGGKPFTEQWAVADPALFAAAALSDSLQRHGIAVSGTAQALHRLAGVPFTPFAPGATIARHESAPLIEDLRVTDKVSQNLHADLLLFDVGGSREAGLQALGQFLETAGIAPGEYRFYDGSGLSRMNLVTPEAVVKLLRYMNQSAHREDWLTLLPVSGVDGSLASRLNGPKVRGRIHAKTGSLNHVSALSGYADTRKGRRLTFSIFVNNAMADSAVQRDLIDKICAVLVD